MADGIDTQDGLAIDASEAETAEVAVGNSSLLPDPRHLLLILWRRIWTFLIVVAAILAAVVAYATLTPKRYSALATVLIEPRKGDPIQARETAPVDQAPTSDFIDTQILVIDSPQNASAVVRALKLADDPEFAAGVTVPTVIGQSDALPI